MTYFMGIDGGGTGCRAVLSDASGTILGQASAGPANIASDPDNAARNILSAAQQAAGDIPLAGIHAGLGLAGACVTGATARLHTYLPFATAIIETDAVTATLGALGDGYGIVAAIGTGSVYTRHDENGLVQIGGRGFAVGDEAGGAWLGRSAVSHALRAADGLCPTSPFLDEIVVSFGGTDATVSWAVTARAADFAALAPRIATSTDPEARAIIAKGADYVLASIMALQPPTPLPVTMIGGLEPVFLPFVQNRWPVIPARGSALDGALSLARRHISVHA